MTAARTAPTFRDAPSVAVLAGSRPDARSAWDDALLTVVVLAVDPRGLGGLRLRARPGPVRDRWLEELRRCLGPDVPIRRVPSTVSEARLIGGLALGETLAAGRPVVERGLLAAVDGGVLVLGMAERAAPSLAAHIASALDQGVVAIERDGLSASHPARFALVALDEGMDDEAVAPALVDRLGLHLDLDAIGWRDTEAQCASRDVTRARARLPQIAVSAGMREVFCAVTTALDARSMRLPLHLLRAARACAAIRGAAEVEPVDVESAIRLVLGLPPPAGASEEDPQGESAREAADLPRQSPPSGPSHSDGGQPPPPVVPEGEGAEDLKAQPPAPETLQEMHLAAAKGAWLPAHLLQHLASAPAGRLRAATLGKSGEDRSSGRRGRIVGTMAAPPFPGARLDVLATLRQAAPWQRVRAAAVLDPPQPASAGARRLHIRPSDFRYLRRRERTGTTTIFALDASGSAAVERLADTKGAIELLLADCYVRRDSVGLIAFRGLTAGTLLEPTRSLVRAKRSLSALPGGGGTPLAGGVMAALEMGLAARHKGQSVVTVFLTDGRGNIALDGRTERASVEADTERVTRLFKASRLRALVIDTARREQVRAQDLARALGAEYLALPRAGAGAVAQAVSARMSD